MKITTLNTQWKKNNLMNFTHRKILFSIYFKPFIHFPGNKNSLEKEKEKLTHFFTIPSTRPKNRPNPAPLHARCPHPGHNLGLGRQSYVATHAHLGRETARSISAVRADPTVVRARRMIKTPTAAAPLKP